MKKIAFLTGAGISEESGIATFRGSGGLWNDYDVMEVASIDGWYKNPELVVQFYNERRQQLESVEPNEAHYIIAELEQWFDIVVITQNVDNLHERAGSSQILHLHGELTKVCTEDHTNIIDIGYRNLRYGEKDKQGKLLRPFIVWFGESVPKLVEAIEIVEQADIFVIVGTSLNVQPASYLYSYTDNSTPIFLIDPHHLPTISRKVEFIQAKATEGMKQLKEQLLTSFL